ncbi:chemotaxis protein CheX [Desulfolithobacter dissulfuricans]|uniref:Chemotaxis protein CheX n=1 Tax=Desulfolithobacter dissulfuricans TaxID=2795293 RepID=A0A915TYZ5_9BACT|nr:chemotaxis protein CheX [Desulfolithobacter dissulfuricans]BCO08558.1 chemotaxis protein CheX [Desulfolithobacter dissulfuricans]
MENFAEIADKMIEATVEIFTTMVMMDVSVAGEPKQELGQLKNTITGMVGLAGTYKGVLAVHIPSHVALAITSSFLGMDVDEMNEDVQDAIGEIANMLGGNVKTTLSDSGKDIQLSLPSTISGEEYSFISQNQGEKVIIPFQAPDGVFHVELELEQ